MTEKERREPNFLKVEQIHEMCFDCGVRRYGHHSWKDDFVGITVHEGVCPVCGKEDVTLIPRSDFAMPGWD